MAEEEKGILDGLVEGICRDIEMNGIIESSRDENEKIDVVKAIAISMGLGYTSTEDLFGMDTLLAASGVFDDDDDTDDYDIDDYDYDNGIDTCVAPAPTPSVTYSKPQPPINQSCSTDNKYKQTELEKLKREYKNKLSAVPKQNSKPQEKPKSSEKATDNLNNCVKTTDLNEIISDIFKEITILIETADKACKATEPSIDKKGINTFLVAFIFITVYNSNLNSSDKCEVYNRAVSLCNLNSDISTPDMFFYGKNELYEIFSKDISVFFQVLAIAKFKFSADVDIVTLFIKISTIMVLLGDRPEIKVLYYNFGKDGKNFVLNQAIKAMDDVKDKHLLD